MYDVGMDTNNDTPQTWRVGGDVPKPLYFRFKDFLKRTNRRSRQTVVDALTEYLNRYDK